MHTIEELEQYAKENYIPIARREMVSFLKQTIIDRGFASVLEIGAAIGYTTIQLAMLPNVHVTTYEYWPPRIEVCKENIKDFRVEDKITFYDYDCMAKPINELYDLIFIDGAKAKTIQLFEFLKNNVKDDGVIIIDNIDLEIVNQIELVNKKKKYQRIVEETKQYFKNVPGYDVEYKHIGDGIYYISKK